jgi:hypothetical protein
MPARDDGPPPGLTLAELTAWAVKQIEVATTEGEIRAAMRVIMATDSRGPRRAFLRYVQLRLLQVGAIPPDTSP